MCDPEHRVAGVHDGRGVGHPVPPAVRTGVDHRPHAGAGGHLAEPLQHPFGELRGGEVAGSLEVQHRDDVPRSDLRRVDEVVRLRDGVERVQVGSGEVIRPDHDARGHGFGAVRRVQRVDVGGALRRLDDREPDAGRGDLRPVDRVLMVAHVDPRQAVGRWSGHHEGARMVGGTPTGRRLRDGGRRQQRGNERERREGARDRAGRPSQCRGFSPVVRESQSGVT